MTEKVYKLIQAERARQTDLFGEQNHHDGTSFMLYDDQLAHYRERNDHAVKNKMITWDLILLEEVFEALRETQEHKIKEELVQIAAVCVAWIEAIDRRTK